MVKGRTRIKRRSDEETEKAVEECAGRVAGKKDYEFFKSMLLGLVRNNVIPVDLLDSVPAPPAGVGKTRFDQVYDAAMSLVFPDYRENTVARLLGPSPPDPGVKIWRAIFPDRFGLTHVLLRARTYQEAFALACDYACRLSLHVYGKIPVDLSVRVMFMSESALRRYLSLREVNRKKKRRDLQLEAREFTPRQVNGARIAAAGPPSDPRHSIFRYAERKDLRSIRSAGGPARESSVESESHKPHLRRRRRTGL